MGLRNGILYIYIIYRTLKKLCILQTSFTWNSCLSRSYVEYFDYSGTPVGQKCFMNLLQQTAQSLVSVSLNNDEQNGRLVAKYDLKLRSIAQSGPAWM